MVISGTTSGFALLSPVADPAGVTGLSGTTFPSCPCLVGETVDDADALLPALLLVSSFSSFETAHGAPLPSLPAAFFSAFSPEVFSLSA